MSETAVVKSPVGDPYGSSRGDEDILRDSLFTTRVDEVVAWSRKNSSVDISPLVTVTLALWGTETQASYREPLAAWA